ncbi:fimbria/pilus outer membrane usher protein [Pseudomonas synxantha]|nr:fimbria/pilus outer membrane usher protein [Pseudomonas synxantha]
MTQGIAGFSANCLWLCIALTFPLTVIAGNSEGKKEVSSKFNTSFLRNGGAGVDLSEFLQGSSVAAGTYRVDIQVNRALIGRQDVDFTKNSKSGRVEACLTLAVLEPLGIDIQALRDAGKLELMAADPRRCLDLATLIEQSSIDYDVSRQQLNIGVPQASMLRSARGYVDPALWDEGVTAGFVDYNFNGRRNTINGLNSNSYFVGMRNGINLGPWRLRNDSNLSSNDHGTFFTSDRTFAQRDITVLKSQLTLGNTYTDARTFDSIRINGVLLASDDAMLPDSQRGYAPTIRGDAETNATVEIRQNGYMLYSTNVAAGPFVIDDIYPNGSNGDLEVTVIEADGRRRTFSQAFASLPQMVRRGTFRQSVAVGKYDGNSSGGASPAVGVAGLAYGLTDETTLLGGVQWAPDFTALNLGVSQNTAIGAFSLDVTQSGSIAQGERRKGQSVRLLYAKTLSTTDTTFTLASYRYSTEGYRTLSEHVTDLDYDVRHGPRGRAKSRFDLTLNQSLGGRQYGSMYLTVGEQRYWNLPGKTQQYTIGYSGGWHSMSYNVGASHALNASSYNDGASDDLTRVTLTISYPLGSGKRRANMSSTLARDSSGELSLQGGVNGSVMERDDTFYAMSVGHESVNGQSFNASVNGATPVAKINVGYGSGNNYRSLKAGASGSIVAHAGGINLGQPIGDSFTLVQVPGVAGTKIGNNAGVTTGRNGYAVVPYSQPYRTNWINLDSTQLGADVEVDNTTQQVIPRRGSVTVAKFSVKKGRRVQFELVRADGSAIPFGSSIENEQGARIAIVDPTGHALALLETDQGVLQVKYGGKACSAEYSLPERSSVQGYDRVRLLCQ